MSSTEPIATSRLVMVPMGRWSVASAPTRLGTLLGSCVGVILFSRQAQVGGLAHVVLPDSRGDRSAHPGKFADTAVPALYDAIRKFSPLAARSEVTAKLIGGASILPPSASNQIGILNGEAVERTLADLGIRVVVRDLGGESGRLVILETTTGIARVRTPGGTEYTL